MADAFVAVLPLPPRDVSPNARVHWAVRHKATKAARKSAWYWFLRALPKGWKYTPVCLDIAYHCPVSSVGYRPRDVQNAIAALKPSIDGMVDAGVVPDDSAKWVQFGRIALTNKRNGEKPGVTITVRPI
jgi:crossover junction endodeoxyribonuclease RusA